MAMPKGHKVKKVLRVDNIIKRRIEKFWIDMSADKELPLPKGINQ